MHRNGPIDHHGDGHFHSVLCCTYAKLKPKETTGRAHSGHPPTTSGHAAKKGEHFCFWLNYFVLE